MIDYSSEFSVWDRYANLSSACEHLGAQNWSTVITDAVNHIAAPTSAQYAIFRNDAATQRLCQIAAARVAWGTPCYAQTWHHCVQHDDDPSLNVFPPQTPRCEWNLPTNYSSSFASGCTSGRSPLHADVAASDQAALGEASCNSAHTCRVLQHPVIPAAAAGLPATDPSLVGFPTVRGRFFYHCDSLGARLPGAHLSPSLTLRLRSHTVRSFLHAPRLASITHSVFLRSTRLQHSIRIGTYIAGAFVFFNGIYD